MVELKRIVYCTDARGRSLYLRWLESLKDVRTRARIQNKVRQLRLGNFSKCKSVGDGIHELKIHFGSGYRVYFATEGEKIVVLIGGGDKSTQSLDIKNVKINYSAYKEKRV